MAIASSWVGCVISPDPPLRAATGLNGSLYLFTGSVASVGEPPPATAAEYTARASQILSMIRHPPRILAMCTLAVQTPTAKTNRKERRLAIAWIQVFPPCPPLYALALPSKPSFLLPSLLLLPSGSKGDESQRKTPIVKPSFPDRRRVGGA
jgi:hypothetical protein